MVYADQQLAYPAVNGILSFTKTSGTDATVGICDSSTSASALLGFTAGSYAYYGLNGNKINNSSQVSYGASYGNNDVIGVALDMDAGTLTFYKNGVSQGQAYSGLSGTFFPAISDATGGAGLTGTYNFGQRAFAYPVSGFKALVDTNLPTPVVAKPNEVMDVVLYTGTASTQSITGLGFSPDLVWIKDRGVGWNHQIYDAVRGVGANKELTSSQTWREGDTTNMNSGVYGYVSSLDSAGFTLNPGSGGAGQYVNQAPSRMLRGRGTQAPQRYPTQMAPSLVR